MPDKRYATLLLITASLDTAAQFARLLPADRFAPEYSVCAPHEAEYAMDETDFDVVVVDGAAPTEDTFSLAACAASHNVSHVLLLAQAESFDETAAYAQEYGYMALPSPVDPALLRQSLGMMAAASARIHELEERANDLQEKMDDLRVVDRAKLILVQRFKMTEKEAHRFIEKNAMDRSVKRRTVAENIIRTYQN